MADKKINQLDDAAALTINDYVPINQNHATGKAVKTTFNDIINFVRGGAANGSRVYFGVGVPSPTIGVNGDVYFDQSGLTIYQKAGGAWVLKAKYGSATDYVRFTSALGSGGLAANGLTYTNATLINTSIVSFQVETDPLIQVASQGDTPLFDEFDFDDTLGKFTFGIAIPAGYRITITYVK